MIGGSFKKAPDTQNYDAGCHAKPTLAWTGPTPRSPDAPLYEGSGPEDLQYDIDCPGFSRVQGNTLVVRAVCERQPGGLFAVSSYRGFGGPEEPEELTDADHKRFRGPVRGWNGAAALMPVLYSDPALQILERRRATLRTEKRETRGASTTRRPITGRPGVQLPLLGDLLVHVIPRDKPQPGRGTGLGVR